MDLFSIIFYWSSVRLLVGMFALVIVLFTNLYEINSKYVDRLLIILAYAAYWPVGFYKRKTVGKFIKDFMLGTFHRANKGIPLRQRPRVGYYFAKEQAK